MYQPMYKNCMIDCKALIYGAETYGRKLQAEDGRLATRVKISEIRRCCTLVS